MPDHVTTSRFILQSDARRDHLIHPLPPVWWSRPYEYAWALSFAREDDVLLDAACGISHPFKFALAEVSREVHACDIDPRITSRSQILEDIARDFGLDAAQRQASDWQHRLHLAHANLADLPYDREKFDRVFCISVLEHMTPEDQSAAIGEFYRTLKPGGLLVLTFDYPAVHLENIQQTLQQAGFTFAGETDFRLPPDALYTEMWGGLHCFRAVLHKPSDA
ncbi:class I SAM-dependent methyltransferase [Paenibacillus sp. FSL M8-0334]|uniref:class I SAM-dependent methyltransferase n=1 Tax=Paenibacillus sp. FSL M8-0334 TaxID=2921623 RepID=UPI0030F74D41